MGIPYSQEINHAFDQVTPLVASGFRVLETLKDISILAALIQVLICLLLSLILLEMLGLLITLNPDLEEERQAIVTPVVKWLASWVKNWEDRKWLEAVLFVVLGGIVLGTWAGCNAVRDPGLVTHDPSVDETVASDDSTR